MEDKELLEKVKVDLGVTGNFLDNKIQGKIDEVINYLIDGGADKLVVYNECSVGLIARGVSDLMGEGDASLSPYFMQRAIQICSKNRSEVYEGL